MGITTDLPIEFESSDSNADGPGIENAQPKIVSFCTMRCGENVIVNVTKLNFVPLIPIVEMEVSATDPLHQATEEDTKMEELGAIDDIVLEDVGI